jgi:hypothetical protein
MARTRRLWWAVSSVSIALTAIVLATRPDVATGSWDSAFPVIALAGLMGTVLCDKPETDALAWLSSCTCLAGALATLAFAVGVGPAGWLAAGALSIAYIALSARALPADFNG